MRTRALLLPILFFSSRAIAEEKKTVAVMPFGSPTRWSEMGNNAQPTFITELVKSKKVRVVDEKRADAAASRFAKESSGHYDQSKVKQIGKFLKADYVLSDFEPHEDAERLVSAAADAVELLDAEGLEAAQRAVNVRNNT